MVLSLAPAVRLPNLMMMKGSLKAYSEEQSTDCVRNWAKVVVSSVILASALGREMGDWMWLYGADLLMVEQANWWVSDSARRERIGKMT